MFASFAYKKATSRCSAVEDSAELLLAAHTRVSIPSDHGTQIEGHQKATANDVSCGTHRSCTNCQPSLNRPEQSCRPPEGSSSLGSCQCPSVMHIIYVNGRPRDYEFPKVEVTQGPLIPILRNAEDGFSHARLTKSAPNTLARTHTHTHTHTHGHTEWNHSERMGIQLKSNIEQAEATPLPSSVASINLEHSPSLANHRHGTARET